jgi:hypothetical protein
MNKNWLKIFLIKQGIMQVKHEMKYKYKDHNLHWQDWRVVPLGPLLILSHKTF